MRIEYGDICFTVTLDQSWRPGPRRENRLSSEQGMNCLFFQANRPATTFRALFDSSSFDSIFPRLFMWFFSFFSFFLTSLWMFSELVILF